MGFFDFLRPKRQRGTVPWLQTESDPEGEVTRPNLFDSYLRLIRVPTPDVRHCLLLFETVAKTRVMLMVSDVQVMRLDKVLDQSCVNEVRIVKIGPDDATIVAWLDQSEGDSDPVTLGQVQTSLGQLQGHTVLKLECLYGCVGAIVCRTVEWSDDERNIAYTLL